MKNNRKGLITGIIVLSIIFAGIILMNQGKKESAKITLQIIGEDYSPMWGLKEIRDQFEEETGVALEVHTFDNVTVRKKYINMFQAGGSEYDVVMTQAFDVGLMSVNDWPVDLTETVAAPETRIEGLDMKDLAPRILDLSCRYDGKLLAMPCSA
ncbi:MAG: extracellular solute-binding protein, partial [Verrucomicrobiales bacterium]|nr:extracellular solute-binding protein [Verrucomicrobiales bacterium]